jgi:3-phenylpropionate/trans-cinnamate dioxygenase ferredoxin reductase subunit
MYAIKAEFDVCQGFGNCVANAPDLFDLDDDDMVVLLKHEVSEDERPHAEQAIRSCPVTALGLQPQ